MQIQEIKKMFLETFGGEDKDLRVFTSPGRVNLIGEHVDYCGGPVFPAALTMKTTIVARKRNDNKIRLKATDLDILVEAEIGDLEKWKGQLKWGDYQLGVAVELENAGYTLCGCDLMYDDTVPHGGGLSSSAAIEVSTALMFATFSNEANDKPNAPINMIEMAKLSQLAEHHYIEVNCGIMDQFASAMGKKDHAIFLDCATLGYELVPLTLGDCCLIISNTNKKHSLGASKYNERRGECEAGLAALQTVMPEIRQLADVSVAEFEQYGHVITDPVVYKRIHHVVHECARVHQSVAALKAGDLTTFGKLMNDSHHSLQYDYEVSCDELDILANEAQKLPYVVGSRMTGAGFGGSTVSIVKTAHAQEFIDTLAPMYEQKVGYAASFYITDIGDGGMEVK